LITLIRFSGSPKTALRLLAYRQDMTTETRILLTFWTAALIAGLIVTIGLPAALSFVSELTWWR